MTTKGVIANVRQAATRLRFRVQRRRGMSLRTQVAAAFRAIRDGIDDKAVYAITKDWYRSSGGDWTLCLS
ncbi:MAG: hypothetical protein R3268_06690 [Acidiferrobacterales bacterium]|nr:hypothetical protein [Acidiferrobacterales bacterium]